MTQLDLAILKIEEALDALIPLKNMPGEGINPARSANESLLRVRSTLEAWRDGAPTEGSNYYARAGYGFEKQGEKWVRRDRTS